MLKKGLQLASFDQMFSGSILGGLLGAMMSQRDGDGGPRYRPDRSVCLTVS